MFWLFKAFGRAIAVLLAWFGILFLAKDISELPDALKAWRPLVPDRETLFIAFSGLLVLWIAWSDARPFVHNYLASRKRHPIGVDPTIYCESHLLREPEEKPALWDNVYYLIVNNDGGERTLRNVSVSLIFLGPPERCVLKDSTAFTADIRHGERAYFELGRIVCEALVGVPHVRSGGRSLSEQEIQVYLHNVPIGHLLFEPCRPGAPRFAASTEPAKNVWTLRFMVSADDLPARTATVVVDLRSIQVTLKPDS
jgi:hypothetical protein